MSDAGIYKDLEHELDFYKKKVLELQGENQKMKEVITENDLEDELDGFESMSEAESICIKGITQILELVEAKQHSDSDIKNFDILYKNLRLIRGKSDEKGKKTKAAKSDNIADLLKIAKG